MKKVGIVLACVVIVAVLVLGESRVSAQGLAIPTSPYAAQANQGLNWWELFRLWIKSRQSPSARPAERVIPDAPRSVSDVEPVDASVPRGQSAADSRANELRQKIAERGTCGFKVTNIAPNSSVHSPIILRGVITRNETPCTWGVIDGSAGSVQMYYSDNGVWKKTGVPTDISVEGDNGAAWMAALNFINERIATPPTGAQLKAVFNDTNGIDASGSHTFELPLIYKGADPRVSRPGVPTCPAGYTCVPLEAGETTTTTVQNCPTGYKCVSTNMNPATSNCSLYTYMGVGSMGSQVQLLQDIIEDRGFAVNDPFGTFGQSTKEALSKFQTANGLPSTGFAGPLTIAKLCGTGGGINAVPSDSYPIIVISPRGGETVALGESLNVIWNSSNPTQSVDIMILNSSGVVVKRQNGVKPENSTAQSIGFSTSGTQTLPLGDYTARVCQSGTNNCANSKGSLKVIAAVTGVSPKISQVSPSPVQLGSTVTAYISGAGRRGNIVLTTYDGTKTWSNGYATDITGLNGFIKYDGSKLSFVLPSTIGRGVHPDGWWNEPTVALTHGTYKLYVTSLDADNNFIKSNVVNVQVGNSSTPSPSPSESPSLPTIKVISPNGGETFKFGGPMAVRWSSTGTGKVSLYLNYPDGATCYLGRTDLAAQYISFELVNNFQCSNIPRQITAGTYYVLATVDDSTNQSNYLTKDRSDAHFTIASSDPYSAPVSVARFTYPSGGEKLIKGNSYYAKHLGGTTGEKVKIELVNSSTGAATLIRSEEPLNTTHESTVFFEIPMTLPAGSYYLKMTKTDGAIYSSAFSVVEPVAAVGVDSPGIVRVFTAGSPMPIKFSASNYPAGTTFTIKLARRDLVVGSTIQPISTIVSGISGTSYTWNIPSSLSGRNDYVIQICPSTGGTCGHSLTFTVNTATPSPTESPSGDASPTSRGNSNFIANVFYSIGDIADAIF